MVSVHVNTIYRKVVDGQTYLFIEAGGFTTGKPADWHPGWYVLKK